MLQDKSFLTILTNNSSVGAKLQIRKKNLDGKGK